jgi:energy-coupling factor transporter ATP-binding protein EcfA2
MTAIAKIVEWANKPDRPIWWKHTIRLLIEKQELTAEHQALIYKIARKESGFPETFENFENYKINLSAEGFELEEKAVTLSSIGPTKNISALEETQILKFSNNGLTVIYGDNGSGKSSYSRILKNACLTRGEKPAVIGNAFVSSKSHSAAKISFQEGGDDFDNINWTYKGDEISALKSIRVFDSKSAFHYLEKEGELDYRPAGLHILDELVSICSQIRSAVDEKIKPLKTPVVLPAIERATKAGLFLNTISTKTTSAELTSFCITEQETLDLKNAQVELVTLKLQTAEELKKSLLKVVNSATPLLNALTKADAIISKQSFTDFSTLIKNQKDTYEAAEELRNSTFTNLPVEKIGTEAWKTLWTSARAFIADASPTGNFPPKLGDSCPLCLQVIGDETDKRLEKFEKYIKDEIQKTADTAKKKKDQRRIELETASLDLAPFEQIISDFEDRTIGFKESISNYVISFVTRTKLLLSEDIQKINNASDGHNPKILEDLQRQIKDITEQAQAIVDDQAVDVILKSKQALEKELLARKIVSDNKTSIEIEIKRQITLGIYEKIKEQTNTRRITNLSSEISEIYLTASLKEHFTDELKLLGFKHYSVEANTRNSNGSQLFKIVLPESTTANVHQIASEGEQKCLALASIFAELRADNRRSGVIFDDPVNSLDHKWRLKIANRLMKESLVRQVIIFTHEIVFLKFLIEAAESDPSYTIQITSLDRNMTSTGLVRNTPPWDALTTAKRIKYLNALHGELKKSEANDTESEYNKLAGQFYGFLREAWERLVEEKLLNKVVERFGRGIQTQRLSKLKDICDEDLDKINNAMAKCSGLFKGHDCAPGVYESMPAANEIQDDINLIKEFEQELTNIRKRN